MDFRDYWRIIRRQWIWSMSIFVLMMSVYLSYSYMVERQQFRATCQVGINAPPMSEQIFRETSSLIPPVVYNMTTKVELMDRERIKEDAARGLLHILEVEVEPPLLASLAESPPASPVQEFQYPFQEVVADVARAHGVSPRTVGEREIFLVQDIRGLADAKGREKAIEALLTRFAAIIPQPERTQPDKTSLVNLSVVYPGAREAVILANAIGRGVRDCDRGSVQKERDDQIRAIEEHLRETMRRIGEAKAKLESFLKAHDLRELDADLEDARGAVRSIESALKAKEAERLKLEHELQAPPPLTVLSGALAEDTQRISEMRSKLSGLRQQMDVMLLELKENHPDVKRLKVQIDRSENEIAQEVKQETIRQQEQHLQRLNDIHDELRLISDQTGELEREKDRMGMRLGELSELRFEHNDLNRVLNYHCEQRDRLQLRKETIELLKTSTTETTGTIKVEKWAEAAEPVLRRTQGAAPLMLVLAFVTSIGVAYLVDYANTRIRTEDDVRKHLNLPVLAKIEKRARGEKVCITELPPRDGFAEIFNTVATVISSASRDLGLQVFVVSSTVAEEGKTTITVNLGVALARKGLRVIVVDGDLRRPQLHDLLGVENTSGLSTILEGRSEAAESLSELSGDLPPQSPPAGVEAHLRQTAIENLRLLPSGPTPHDPVTLLESQRMKDLIRELRGQADFILIDTPPIFHVGDVLTMTPLVDANLFVVGAFEVKQHEVTWAKHLLSNVEANILGVFLNKEVIESKSYYYYYRYYKSYRYRN